MKHIILAAALALATVGISAAPAEAGRSCYPATASRSGDYVTYSAYGTGPGWHQVKVVRNGVWSDGSYHYGTGYSRVTLYHPGYTGIAICVVL
jgi:hypothetical protein